MHGDDAADAEVGRYGRQATAAHDVTRSLAVDEGMRMAWIKTIGIDEAEGLLAKIYNAKIATSGRVSPLTSAMSLNPHTLRNMQALYQAIMASDSPLSKAQRCLLALVVSRVNGCHY